MRHVLLPLPAGEGWGEGTWALGLRLFRGRSREFAPAGDSLSFASPKESKQRKGDPTARVPPLRYGQPAVLAEGIEQVRAVARTWVLGCWLFGRPSEAMARVAPPPLWLRRGAQCSRPHACRRTGMLRGLTCRSCLSRVNEVNVASSAAGRLCEHRRLPRSFAAGSQTVGSPFFGYFLWRSKESDSPAGANSRLQAQAKSSNDSKAQGPQKRSCGPR
jgi:hypothetical protein